MNSPPSRPVQVANFDTPGYSADVALSGDYAYVADRTAGLRVINISNPTSPQEVGSLTTLHCPYGVAVSGNYAYVADEDSGLRVVNVSNPAGPELVGGLNTPGWAYSVTLFNTNFALVCDGDKGLRIINVSSPSSPYEVARVDTSGWSHRVAMIGSYAYLADDDAGLRVINLADPANPTIVLTGRTPSLTHGVAVAGSHAYLANGLGGLKIINISRLAAPYKVGELATPGISRDVKVYNNLAYVADDAAGGLRIVNVANPAAPVEVGNCNTPGQAYGVAVSGDFAYVADMRRGLRIINVSNPAGPTEVGRMESLGNTYGVAVSTPYCYLACGDSGLRVIDVSTPSNPRQVGRFDTRGIARGLDVAGTYVYVADDTEGLRVIDVSSPASPREVGSCNTPWYAQRVAVSGTRAFVADWYGTRVIDISTPTNPAEIGFYGDAGSAAGCAVVGNHVFVADLPAGLQIYEVFAGARRHDVGVTSIVAPSGQIDTGATITPKATVHNFGDSNEEFPVTFKIGESYEQTVTRTLAPGATETVEFEPWVAQALGTFQTTAFTALGNDENRGNDTTSGSVTVLPPARHDVGVTRILAPTGQIDSGTVVTPRAVIKNFGTRNEQFPVTFRIGTTYTQTVNASLVVGQTDTVRFPNWVAQPLGRFQVLCRTELENDENRGNDTIIDTDSVRVIPAERHDVGAIAVLVPGSQANSGSTIVPTVLIRNFGTRDEESFPVTFKIGTLYSQTLNASVKTGKTDTVRFPVWEANPVGTHSIVCYTALARDVNRANDTTKSRVDVLLVPDVGTEEVLAPTGTVSLGEGILKYAVSPAAKVANYGQRVESEFAVKFRMDSILVSSGHDTTWLGTAYEQTALVSSLEPGKTLSLSFPAAELPLGRYAVTCSTMLASDGNTANDRGTVYCNLLPFKSGGPGEFEAIIYTRAGEHIRTIKRQVREGDALLAQWDGKNDKGTMCAPDVYVCRLRFTPTEGSVQRQSFNLLVTKDFTGIVLTWR